jgi:hypothetical protein
MHTDAHGPHEVHQEAHGQRLASHSFCKHKYQKGFIHRKLRVPYSVIFLRPRIQYVVGKIFRVLLPPFWPEFCFLASMMPSK